MSRFVRGAALGAMVLLCSAHVGSPDAWYEGPAGPYTVLVHVEAPPVIPGIAVVNVRPKLPGISRISAYVNRFDAVGSPPPPDVAAPLSGRPGWYRTRLWVMTSGSNSVTVVLEGARGRGAVVVPLAAVAARRLAFSPLLAGLLLALGLTLAAGLFTIVGAAVREGVLPPGVEPDAARRRRARVAMARAMAGVALGLAGWMIWWRADDRRFVGRLFRPLAVRASLDTTARPARLILTVTDSIWVHRQDGAWLRARRLPEPSELIEDHGKLMHLFLITAGGGPAFAHLHPASADQVSFDATLPRLPAGRYAVFADVVHASGFTETLTTTIELPLELSSAAASTAGDSDDSWSLSAPAVENRADLEDGATLAWLRPAQPLVAGEEADLRFALGTRSGLPAPAELYLGMAGHAAVVRSDDSVFIHLHPLGTISLAAQARLLRGAPGSPAASMSHPQPGDTLYFPYAFPKPGRYTVWVQLKRGGRILTGAFPALVLPASAR